MARTPFTKAVESDVASHPADAVPLTSERRKPGLAMGGFALLAALAIGVFSVQLRVARPGWWYPWLLYAISVGLFAIAATHIALTCCRRRKLP